MSTTASSFGICAQLGGGVNLDNAAAWLAKGASHVIVTSFVFAGGEINLANLNALVALVGKDRIVLDLSCRKRPPEEVRPTSYKGRALKRHQHMAIF